MPFFEFEAMVNLLVEQISEENKSLENSQNN